MYEVVSHCGLLLHAHALGSNLSQSLTQARQALSQSSTLLPLAECDLLKTFVVLHMLILHLSVSYLDVKSFFWMLSLRATFESGFCLSELQ